MMMMMMMVLTVMSRTNNLDLDTIENALVWCRFLFFQSVVNLLVTNFMYIYIYSFIFVLSLIYS